MIEDPETELDLDELELFTDSGTRSGDFRTGFAIPDCFSSIQRWMSSGRKVEMLMMVKERRDDDGERVRDYG